MMKGISFKTSGNPAVEGFLRSKEEYFDKYDKIIGKHLSDRYEIYPDAEERLCRIRELCRSLSNGGEVETVKNPEFLHVYVTFSAPFLELFGEKREEFSELLLLSLGTEIYERDGRIWLNVIVPYYKEGQLSPFERASKELDSLDKRK